ncbi:hypothetical protein GCM10010448_32470 [Streptomyces glomeratus]|uniref:Uncharacterized protein n=1 Tax=Streptomyces glomeratus TaxID=284452 RepID=A0ABP6LLV4_9ACTN
MEIELDHIEARALRGNKGPEGVLGFDTHDSAVTDGEEVQGSTRFRRRRLGCREAFPHRRGWAQPNGPGVR